MAARLTLTHAERVALYVKIIESKQLALSDYTVALMRNGAPSKPELDALNLALVQLGWQH